MGWSSKFHFVLFNKFEVYLWRSDSGLWGYRHDYYDGNWYCFGFGKLLHITWGDWIPQNWY